MADEEPPVNDFYDAVIEQLTASGDVSTEDRILVICAGDLDRATFLRAGFKNVVISNLDERMTGDSYSPFQWSFEDGEKLTFPDDSFDFTVVHSGLHHCYSPHRSIAEMLRVARKGIIGFEPKDGLFTILGARLGFGQVYEDAAVAANDYRYGGVANTEIPNYVYRFGAHEIEKTGKCLLPHGEPRFQFFHALRLNWGRFEGLKNRFFLVAIKTARPLLEFLGNRVPFFANNMAFVIFKPRVPEDLHPWIKSEDGEIALNEQWLREKYDMDKDQRQS